MISKRLLYRVRHRIHHHYIEMSRQFPDIYPPGKISTLGADVWYEHVPGCGGSTCYGSTGDSFMNMINCRCHMLEWAPR